MGTRINLEATMMTHPKIRRLRIYCGQNAEIFIIRLWLYCAEFHSKDGELSGYTESEIEGLVGWDGTPGNLIRALKDLRFLDKVGDMTLQIHDWEEHAGFVWKYREAGRKGGIRSGKSRRFKTKPPSSQPSTHGSTMEWNGIERNNKPPNPLLGGFDLFWQAYPRRVGKGAAERVWVKLKPDQELVAKILGAVSLQRKGDSWIKDGGVYIPHPSTWLNQRRWEDDIQKSKVQEPLFDPDAMEARRQELERLKDQEWERRQVR